MKRAPLTVVETDEFSRHSATVFTADELDALKAFLAENPEAGVVMRGTGGVRKLRWRRMGTGKRGGARVIYFFHNESLPLFLFDVYAKSAKQDLTTAQRKDLRQVIAEIIRSYGPKR